MYLYKEIKAIKRHSDRQTDGQRCEDASETGISYENGIIIQLSLTILSNCYSMVELCDRLKIRLARPIFK